MGLEERQFLQLAYQGLVMALPRFRSDSLQQVYFLNHRERRGYVTVWWITLESYSSGFILAGHCGVAGRESGRGDYCGLYGVTVEDDLGQVYLSQGASGGELGTRLSFVPGLDPRARQVRVTLRSAILVSSEEPHRDPRSPRARPTHTEESLLDQPWAFDIPLEAPADGAASR